MSEDPTFRTKWLMTICAAFAIVFLFALGSSGCMQPAEPLPETETEGGELPEYEASGADEIEDDETDLLGLYDPDR